LAREENGKRVTPVSVKGVDYLLIQILRGRLRIVSFQIASFHVVSCHHSRSRAHRNISLGGDDALL